MGFDWQGLGRAVLESINEVAVHNRFVHFIVLDRSAAVQQISAIVDQCSGREFTQFEHWFLWNCSQLTDPDLKVRAAELYAWLKVKWYIRYSDFSFHDEQVG
jgi:hypothetical protein